MPIQKTGIDWPAKTSTVPKTSRGPPRRTAEMIARSAGATAEVTIDSLAPVTYNDPALTERMAATLRRVAGDANVGPAKQTTGAEDFGYFQQQVPGLFVFLGVAPKGAKPADIAPNHSPRFYADEGALPVECGRSPSSPWNANRTYVTSSPVAGRRKRER